MCLLNLIHLMHQRCISCACIPNISLVTHIEISVFIFGLLQFLFQLTRSPEQNTDWTILDYVTTWRWFLGGIFSGFVLIYSYETQWRFLMWPYIIFKPFDSITLLLISVIMSIKLHNYHDTVLRRWTNEYDWVSAYVLSDMSLQIYIWNILRISLQVVYAFASFGFIIIVIFSKKKNKHIRKDHRSKVAARIELGDNEDSEYYY